MSVHISTLGYALLALLARKSHSGYDLARHLKKPIGFFWQAQHSQIYPELARLEEQGYVTHEIIVQEDRPHKKLYTITEMGQETLKAWIPLPPAPPPERNELLLKAYTIWLADPQQAIELFRACERSHAANQAHFEQILNEIEQEGIPYPDEPRFGDYATLHMGVAYEREYLAWCRWMVEQLELALAQKQQDSTD